MQRAGHHQPDWETNESLYAETNELETAEEPDTTSQTGRQNESLYGETNEFGTSGEMPPQARLGDK